MTIDFEALGLRPELLQAVSDMGYETPTPIQEAAIPPLLHGQDLLGQAQTGTGKTAAFALPLLQQLTPGGKHVQALILAPTRELAGQVAEALYAYGRPLHTRVLPIYGGQSYTYQIGRLQRGVDVVVGTPGRILDLLDKGALDLSQVRFVVLDEADEMLSMGFIEDIETILGATPEERQTALFSATLPQRIRQLADKYMHSPEAITTSHERITVAQIIQRYYLVNQNDKLAALARLLETEELTNVLIFARTKIGAAELAGELSERGFPAEALHGDLGQAARETTLRRFRRDQSAILVATDVAARGLDIEDISHVINYDIPWDEESYVHRIGRTGRAGKAGIAITLVTPQERRRLRNIEVFTRQSIQAAKLPTVESIQAQRDSRFLDQLADAVAEGGYEREHTLAEQLVAAGSDPLAIAAAALRLARADEQHRPIEPISEVRERVERRQRSEAGRRERSTPKRARPRGGEQGMRRLIVTIGKSQGIRPSDIVGLIANEAGIPGKSVGAIIIESGRTLVDVAEQYAERVLRLQHCRLRGWPVAIHTAE